MKKRKIEHDDDGRITRIVEKRYIYIKFIQLDGKIKYYTFDMNQCKYVKNVKNLEKMFDEIA